MKKRNLGCRKTSWTPALDAELHALYHDFSINLVTVAARLGLTLANVQNRSRQLGFSARRFKRCRSKSEVCYTYGAIDRADKRVIATYPGPTGERRVLTYCTNQDDINSAIDEARTAASVVLQVYSSRAHKWACAEEVAHFEAAA